MPEAITYETRKNGNVALITLDRPEKMNALNQTLIDELVEYIDKAEKDDEIRAIVLTGAGEDAFSAGYDLEPGSHEGGAVPSVDNLLDRFEESTVHVHAIWDCNKPVIAAVNGYCLAGGSDIAMASDLVIASEEAEFGYPGMRMGGTPPTIMYPFVMNLHETKELLFSGKFVDAERADELGMLNRVVPDGEEVAAAMEEVEEILKVPGNNVRIMKHILNGIAEMQGAKPILKYSELFDTLGHQTEYGKEYFRIAESEGLDAALKYIHEEDKGMENPDRH